MENINNVRRIDDFLKMLANSAKYNIELNANTVYGNLIFLGVENKDVDISSNFENWVSHFLNIDNINVFVDPSWRYFCQFKNMNSRNFDPYSMIKLYIPLDKEHIEVGAKKIFEFLASENIFHVSKIGSHVRFDDIVVRVTSSLDANKIISFISNDSYLKEGLLPSSPFASSFNNISVSWDGTLSYNQVISSLVSDYINFERENNNLDNVGYSRFFAYVKSKYDSLFVNGVGLDELVDKLIDDGIIRADDDFDYKLLNYRDVTHLILSNLDLEKNMSVEGVYDYVKNVSNSKYQYEQINNINKLRNTRVVYEFTEQQKAALKLSFDYMCERYGFDIARKQFNSYLYDGNYDLITRYKGARDLIKDNGITKDIASKIILSWKKEALFDAMELTYNKYNYLQLQSALTMMVKNNDFSRFTNDNNCRIELINRFSDNFPIVTIKEILKNEGYDINLSNEELVNLVLEDFFDKNKKKTANL